MKGSDRKAAVAAYKERKTSAGVFAVRCLASGETWVGQAPDVDAIRNRLWFTLKLGTNPHRGLQRAWNAEGAERFAFEVLERLTDDDLPYIRAALPKQRLAHWRTALRAGAV